MKKLLIPVSDAIGVTPESVEKHCADAGWIVTNVALAPQDASLVVNGRRLWNGDGGVDFWFAEIVAKENT